MDPSLPKSDTDLQRPLDHFRANKKRLEIHPTEKAVLWVVCLHLVFLPWAIGAMAAWSQWTSLGLALLGFVLALIPRNYTEDHTGTHSFRLVMWPRPITDSSNATTSAPRPSPRTTPAATGPGAGAVKLEETATRPRKREFLANSIQNEVK